MFEKFVRLGVSGRRKKGTGLGLFICREIISKHGGRIWAESENGKGLRFILALPKK